MGHADQKSTRVRLERLHKQIQQQQAAVHLFKKKVGPLYRVELRKLRALEWERQDVLGEA